MFWESVEQDKEWNLSPTQGNSSDTQIKKIHRARPTQWTDKQIGGCFGNLLNKIRDGISLPTRNSWIYKVEARAKVKIPAANAFHFISHHLSCMWVTMTPFILFITPQP
jgi:hypothetical protein